MISGELEVGEMIDLIALPLPLIPKILHHLGCNLVNKLHIKWVLTSSSDSLKEIMAVLRTKSFFGALYSDFTLRKTNRKSKSP